MLLVNVIALLGMTSFYFLNSDGGVCLFPHTHQKAVLSSFWISASPVSEKYYVSIVLICTLLMKCNIFSYVEEAFLDSFCESSVHISCLAIYRIFIPKNSLYIRDISPLSEITLYLRYVSNIVLTFFICPLCSLYYFFVSLKYEDQFLYFIFSLIGLSIHERGHVLKVERADRVWQWNLMWSIRKRGVRHDSQNLTLANRMLEFLLTEENCMFVEKTRNAVLATLNLRCLFDMRRQMTLNIDLGTRQETYLNLWF